MQYYTIIIIRANKLHPTLLILITTPNIINRYIHQRCDRLLQGLDLTTHYNPEVQRYTIIIIRANKLHPTLLILITTPNIINRYIHQRCDRLLQGLDLTTHYDP